MAYDHNESQYLHTNVQIGIESVTPVVTYTHIL